MKWARLKRRGGGVDVARGAHEGEGAQVKCHAIVALGKIGTIAIQPPAEAAETSNQAPKRTAGLSFPSFCTLWSGERDINVRSYQASLKIFCMYVTTFMPENCRKSIRITTITKGLK